MESRDLGPLEVSVVGLGCNNFGRRIGESESAEIVAAALEAGVTLFDTADVYGDGESERVLGRALGGRRDGAIIATKFGSRMGEDPQRAGACPAWVRRAAQDSLRRLGTDTIDLYQLHTPDPEVPIAETLGALDELVQGGDVRAVGCSNLSADQIDEAQRVAEDGGLTAFVSVQNRYSVLARQPEEDGVLDACERHGLGFLPYFPLESGLLTGKYSDGFDGVVGRLSSMTAERRRRFAAEEKVAAVDRLAAAAAARGRTILELAISWLLSRPTVASVIPGATRPEQVRANVAAAGWTLDPEVLAEIDRIAPS
jgi:aryl-alcohol dehydrogenase-like predicted oxidoreductase